ncbi:hypothetical protein CFRA_08850 [Corynebacterium frankenforstense DSM 45800]|uniref:Sugar kinase n=1 Tax=Corynebacterium frankenforstense DSM 45800 TaxID=1437875 RepID=A0A1L7CU37_9CORY|nr:FGGY family carbohydrate kinase [Corynebacterium frankenforstense]APT89339.1 hypothetical protein CFRA_08850 [Corynebacterium frankenforstense DSM 45800]
MVVLALDLGTSGAKAALVDGRVLTAARHPYPTDTAPDGRSEQDPDDWLAAARAAVTEVLAAGPAPERMALTGQMQDVICLDAAGRPLGPAVLYDDTRAEPQARALAAELPDWAAVTGNEQNATSSAAVLRRLRETGDPRAAAATVLFSPAGYLAHELGCPAAVDSTTASTTGLMDLDARAWSPAVCAAAGVDPATLPAIADGPLGTTAAELLGLPAGLPVDLAPGDAAATTAGVVGLTPGDDYVYLGTSGWHARVVKRQTTQPGLVHRLAAGDAELRIAALTSAGATAAWARRAFLADATPEDADRLLTGRPRGFTGVLALPSLHGERFPVRDAGLGAALVGVHEDHGPAELYAAVLEGVALALSHSGLDSDAVLPVTGGGSHSRPWLEILADVTGRPVRAVSGTDAALLGAAGCTAAAEGEVIAPDPAAVASYRGVRARHRHLYDVLGELG